MSSAAPVTIKVYMSLPSGKQEIRRFTSAPPVFPALTKMLSETYAAHYGDARFVLTYDDGEDLITIGTESELQSGLEVHQQSGPNAGVFKILARMEAPQSDSGLASPNPLSGLSTPSAAAMLRVQESECPSPSRLSVSEIKAPQEESAKSSLLQAQSVRSDDEAELLDGSNSEDEYERIEVESAQSPKPVAEPVVVAAVPAAVAEVEANETVEATAELAAALTVSAPKVTEPQASEPAVSVEDVTGQPQFVLPSPEPQAQASALPAVEPQVEVVKHAGITCDGCGQSPIVGVRFHCTVCTMPGGFDLCESCESLGNKHPASHVLLKMRVPATIVPAQDARRNGAPRSGPRPKAEFVSDVNLADGLQVHAGETLKKIWSIRNSGPSAWPAGTRLIFAGGDLMPESQNRVDQNGALVPFAAPGEVVHVAIDIQVPEAAGRYRSTFRLQTADGERFGPRIWVDLAVPAEEAKKPQEKIAPVSASASFVERKEVDEEAAQICAAIAASEADMKATEERVAAKAKAEADHAAAVAKAAAEAAAAAAEAAKPKFQFADELALLNSMGFKDGELCRYLLLNNNGDVQKVATWLLTNSK